MAGLVPAIPIYWAQPCLPERDRRDKPGDDVLEFSRNDIEREIIKTRPAPIQTGAGEVTVQ
jgi:hypothetical protein